MDNYLKEIIRVVELRGSDVDGIMIVNKDGVVEYYSHWGGNPSYRMPRVFTKYVAGKHLLDVYPDLQKEGSTVMETLRTGKTTSGDKQVLNWGEYKMTIIATTYPIMENGIIKGAVDAAKVLSLEKKGKVESTGNNLHGLEDILSINADMIRLKEVISTLANSNSPVLIYGETGTGKQLVAEAIHGLSMRRGKPFISQNCAAIPENLLESLFFGTEKGGFTGAESRQGLFELASGGTLFLDEINSMSPAIQGKLLKALDEQKVRRLGGKEDIKFDVRIISASNEDLEEMIKKRTMRSDLFYRVSVVKIKIPPLRDRREDIPLLVSHFIEFFNKTMNKNIEGLSLMATPLFERWEWPGNIRELRNTIESAFNIEKSNVITLNSLQDFLGKVNSYRGDTIKQKGDCHNRGYLEEKKIKGEENIDLKSELKKYERQIIEEKLEIGTSLNTVAQKLGISPQKLQYRLKVLGIKK